MTSANISSLILVASAIVATIAAYMAYREARAVAEACASEVDKALLAMSFASVAIARVASSRASRLAAESAARDSSFLRSHS